MTNYNEMKNDELMDKLRDIASLLFPGPVARQNAEKIVAILRQRNREEYE